MPIPGWWCLRLALCAFSLLSLFLARLLRHRWAAKWLSQRQPVQAASKRSQRLKEAPVHLQGDDPAGQGGERQGQGAQAGALYLIEVLIALNIFIGIVNLFPVLPLDGGHVAIAMYEKARSRRGRRYYADAAKMMPAAYALIALLVVLFTTSLYLDLAHPIANPFH